MAKKKTSSAKAKMIAVIDAQGDDSSYDDLLRELAFYRLVERGLKDLDEDRTMTTRELRRQVKSWRG